MAPTAHKESTGLNLQQNPITLGCVPEHFSGPLYLSPSPSVNIKSCPGETCSQLLETNSTSINLSGSYTNSSLCWSVAVAPDSKIKKLQDLRGGKIGISRLGSGSHIMAVVLAMQNGWPDFEFVILNDINGLIKGVNEGTADAFMWEPYYDKKVLSMLDTFYSPWPAFMLATRTQSRFNIPEFQKYLKTCISEFVDNFESKGLPLLVEKKDVFHYPDSADVKTWFKDVKFTSDPHLVQRSSLQHCVDTLVKANLIDSKLLKEWEDANGKIVERICQNVTFE
ncbi:hypothetical protein HK103_006379 [Boothiomyces macroporosus]|uniref:Ca3427-like PBP 2 domain-containing protein n=1 Tax=Boothiomyces macroporosus TaxID=261099 RepID=A0AAD5UGW5_9FUNG|nr:hypothetical protein HK103_006379 [Boothiomyces macroporosus]